MYEQDPTLSFLRQIEDKRRIVSVLGGLGESLATLLLVQGGNDRSCGRTPYADIERRCVEAIMLARKTSIEGAVCVCACVYIYVHTIVHTILGSSVIIPLPCRETGMEREGTISWKKKNATKRGVVAGGGGGHCRDENGNFTIVIGSSRARNFRN